MILEAVIVVGAVVLVERAYKAYKNGTLVTEVITLASNLKNDVTSIESKVKTGVAIAEADVKAVIVSAKAVLAKVGL